MKTLSLLLAFAAATTLDAVARPAFPGSTRTEPEVRLESRNMPRTCQFVFEVESDLRLRATGLEAGEWKMLYSYVDAYDAHERGLEPGELELRDGRAEWSLRSFHAPTRFLRRIVEFHFEQRSANGRLAARWPRSASQVYRAEFGREFGEPCVSSGRPDTPWRERVVESVGVDRRR